MDTNNCEICNQLGKRLSVDHLEGERFPLEYQRLDVVPGSEDEALRCPICGQAYSYEHKWDNDVYNRYDISTIRRIPEEEVKRILESKREWAAYLARAQKRFQAKVRRKFGERLDALEGRDKRLFEYLKERENGEADLQNIIRDLEMPMDELVATVERLEKQGLVKRKVYWPLSPGEHNFQGEVRTGDPLDYTQVWIDML